MKNSKLVNIAAVGIAVMLALAGCATSEVKNLHDAATDGGTQAIAAFVEAGEDINKKDEDGWTPLHRAANEGNHDIVAVLIKAGGNVNAISNEGWTPLHLAASREVVAALIEAGADVNPRDNHGWTPLHWSVFYANKDVAEELVKAGAYMNARDKLNWTPVDFLYSCSRKKDVKDRQKHLANCQATVDFLRQKGGVCISKC